MNLQVMEERLWQPEVATLSKKLEHQCVKVFELEANNELLGKIHEYIDIIAGRSAACASLLP
jgi:hypothetical protein